MRGRRSVRTTPIRLEWLARLREKRGRLSVAGLSIRPLAVDSVRAARTPKVEAGSPLRCGGADRAGATSLRGCRSGGATSMRGCRLRQCQFNARLWVGLVPLSCEVADRDGATRAAKLVRVGSMPLVRLGRYEVFGSGLHVLRFKVEPFSASKCGF